MVGPLICMGGKATDLKSPGFSPHQAHRRALSFSSGACEIKVGNNSQCSLGGTTCRHPYEATTVRSVPEAPWFSDESFVKVFIC